jgi:hypothetical protein
MLDAATQAIVSTIAGITRRRRSSAGGSVDDPKGVEA